MFLMLLMYFDFFSECRYASLAVSNRDYKAITGRMTLPAGGVCFPEGWIHEAMPGGDITRSQKFPAA